MELIIHIGLPKTGSTFLQSIFHHNRDSFREGGLYYCSQPHDVAAHPSAFSALAGQVGESALLVAEAVQSGCPRALLSSENFGTLIFRPGLFLKLLQALRSTGAGKIRIVIFIRRQDEMFWSLHDTISRSIFVDPFSMFYETMRCGYFAINETHRQTYAPYYCFCFDHNTQIGNFAGQMLGSMPDTTIEIHDFDTPAAFPGESFLKQLGVLERIHAYPGENLQNRRRPDAEVVASHADAFIRVIGPTPGCEMREIVEARLAVSAQVRAAISSALFQRYHPGNAILLRRFPPPPLG
ncbi:MAG: hypothetical protein RIB84_21175 [Sneathiellaceae bacterium]